LNLILMESINLAEVVKAVLYSFIAGIFGVCDLLFSVFPTPLYFLEEFLCNLVLPVVFRIRTAEVGFHGEGIMVGREDLEFGIAEGWEEDIFVEVAETLGGQNVEYHNKRRSGGIVFDEIDRFIDI
jgi:hypothetical protein